MNHAIKEINSVNSTSFNTRLPSDQQHMSKVTSWM